jgi:arsenite methyltransferase
MSQLKSESAVKERYAAAAQAQEAALCCPVDYDRRFLEIIPEEVIERDYGCGDPSKHLHEGETVLDLGSGTGKICFIAAQVVGPKGKVIGVDMTDDMLEVARRNQPLVAERMGYDNLEFRKGRIQDLALDLEQLDRELKSNPINDADAFLKASELADELRAKAPLIATESVDVVVSNCVLNLVDERAKELLFSEIFRVLKIGGRAVISDIVSGESVPEEMRRDPALWSGCISGAFREDDFLAAFENAGFHGIEILNLDPQPWQTVQGIEFRSLTLQAFKGAPTRGLERNQAVIYKGPFKKVLDDDNNAMERGKRYAVSDAVFNRYRHPPYAGAFELIEPRRPVPEAEADAFNCAKGELRHPRETKGADYQDTTAASSCCESAGNECC